MSTRSRFLIAAVLTAAIIVFGVGQLVLPPLAEHVVRGRLDKNGRVLSVSVSAFPAIELIFGDADSVKVHMASYTATQTQVAAKINQAAGVHSLDVDIGQVNSGSLKITQVSLVKRGAQITGAGRISEDSLRSVIPLLKSVTPVSSQNGALTLQGTTDDLPIVGSVTADASVGADNGQVVVSGAGLLTSFLHITVWSDPHVYVESISGRSSGGSLALSARARLQ